MVHEPALEVVPPTGAVPRDRDWELTFERSPIGMAVVAPDGSLVRVNQAFCLMLGRSADELAHGSFQAITHPPDLAADVDLVAECLTGRRDGYRMTKRYVHADGRLIWGDLSVALVRHDDGRPMHFVSQVLDITEQRQDRDRLEGALERLRTVNADLEAFAAIASHELKTPLTGVRASLELIGELLATPDAASLRTAASLAARGESAVDRMATLLDALLALTTTKVSRGPDDAADAAGAGGAVRPPVTVSSILDATLADLPTSLRRADVTIEPGPHVAAAPALAVEPDLVRTLLTTLIANAVKYRDADRHLTVGVDIDDGANDDGVDPGFLTVRVHNDGPPIPATELDRVFTLHSRGAATAPVAGAGIGLAVSKSIVEWHGGRIWIDSGPTAGVSVGFTLPLAPPTRPL